ncbi:hypothetical protein OSTOST_02297, partial [Ostertagia ostertagi]
MSNLRGHKSRLTSAVGTLSKTISSVDLTYLTSLDTSTAPEIQLREIIRRRATITGKKFAIQRALEVVKERYNALMLFVQSREDSSSLSEEIDQFWSQLYGEKFEQDATETILALDTQLTIDELIGLLRLVLNVDSMSNLRGHKSRLTSAVGTLSKTISSVDLTYLTSLDTSTAPEIQLREIIRRRATITGKKFAIQRALEVVKERYNALMLFVQSREDSSSLSEEIDQFWSQLYGEKFEQDATETILALDTQLTIDEAQISRTPQQLLLFQILLVASIRLATPRRNLTGKIRISYRLTTPPLISRFPLVQPIQLRRLELPTFDGDVTQFHDFWCRFKAAVHDNDSLSLATKFIYLTNSLRGPAALIIQGYDPSKSENYHLAVQTLKKRYDRPQFTHNLFHHKLEQLPTSSISASSQRDTLSHIQSYVLQLNRFEDTTTSLSLMKLIRKKFPRDTQMEVNKLEHRSGKIWTLPELLDGFNEVIEELEQLEDHQHPIINPKTRKQHPVVILLDTGAQTSFISKAAVEEHQLDVFEQDLLTTYSFGAVSTTEHSGKSYITLIDRHNQPISLVLHTKDRLTIPSPPTRLTEEDREILRLLNVSLHSLTA